ncbi:hypothetical protein B0T11DRAFT_271383 [Plectosphaerella cucumerina]|uniref:Uncharacterized protein n=1 Tax=Plectosphaerella cucumerina TaxID=40658 RepID=A0A8K0TPF5_9PEZI|nr:hypothetical protein B0T11DRAFT_271383 [Plectosphaerella cucumerina]
MCSPRGEPWALCEGFISHSLWARAAARFEGSFVVRLWALREPWACGSWGLVAHLQRGAALSSSESTAFVQRALIHTRHFTVGRRTAWAEDSGTMFPASGRKRTGLRHHFICGLVGICGLEGYATMTASSVLSIASSSELSLTPGNPAARDLFSNTLDEYRYDDDQTVV